MKTPPSPPPGCSPSRPPTSPISEPLPPSIPWASNAVAPTTVAEPTTAVSLSPHAFLHSSPSAPIPPMHNLRYTPKKLSSATSPPRRPPTPSTKCLAGYECTEENTTVLDVGGHCSPRRTGRHYPLEAVVLVLPLPCRQRGLHPLCRHRRPQCRILQGL